MGDQAVGPQQVGASTVVGVQHENHRQRLRTGVYQLVSKTNFHAKRPGLAAVLRRASAFMASRENQPRRTIETPGVGVTRKSPRGKNMRDFSTLASLSKTMDGLATRSPMKTFHCTHCQNLVFFENVRCLNCDRSLAFLPDRGVMAALTQSPDGLWRAEIPGAETLGYRLCANYDGVSVCNWVICADDPSDFCRSCRLNQVIPDLSSERNAVAWFRWRSPSDACSIPCWVSACRWSRKASMRTGARIRVPGELLRRRCKRILTGHDNGLITLNIAEADDVHREKERTLQKEPYRTLLGIFATRSAIISGTG